MKYKLISALIILLPFIMFNISYAQTSTTETTTTTTTPTTTTPTTTFVPPGDQPLTHDDVLITSAVKDKIASDETLKTTSIDVSTTNGVVTLSGTALNQGQIDNAINLAKTTKDVKEVNSTITIK